MAITPAKAFKPGGSGNPAGKSKGAANHATRLVMGLMHDGADKTVLDRLAPPIRESPISIDLPDTATVQGCADAANTILQGVAVGDLLPGEGVAHAGIVENRAAPLKPLTLNHASLP